MMPLLLIENRLKFNIHKVISLNKVSFFTVFAFEKVVLILPSWLRKLLRLHSRVDHYHYLLANVALGWEIPQV